VPVVMLPTVTGHPPADARQKQRMPPLEPKPKEMILLRDSWTNVVTVVLGSGDSYTLPPDDLLWYLKRLGCPTADQLVNYVWSFCAVWVGAIKWRYHRISPADAKRVFLQRR